ncbi:MAG: tetratricopeptide repeat protein, partial [Candidatus Omnitrophica bacterium]|nr:tetratricopeptide repeat protein [Candidatus Omnitrophota bacterium]
TADGKGYLGSGFIVDKNGILVTNYHVIRYAKEINVKLKDGTVYPVTSVIYNDANRDICIFKIDAANLPVIPLGDSKALRIGEKVYCIGNSAGLDYSFSDGVLSGIRDLNNLKWLQFTAPVSSGSSGGPLINSRGEAVGVVTMGMYPDASTAVVQNINFALVINEIKPHLTASSKKTLSEITNLSTAQIDNYFMEINQCFLRDDYDQAIVKINQGLQIEPNVAGLYSLRGLAYGKKGDFERALVDYNKALELDPNFATAYCERGGIYFLKGYNDQAIADYTKAIEMEPNEARYYSRRAGVYSKKNNFKQAMADANKAIELDPTDDAYLSRGLVHSNSKDFDRAIADYSHALQINPYSVQTYLIRGLAYVEKGDNDRAIADYAKVLEIDPGSLQAYVFRAIAYFRKKDCEQGWKDVHKAESLGFKFGPDTMVDFMKCSQGAK